MSTAEEGTGPKSLDTKLSILTTHRASFGGGVLIRVCKHSSTTSSLEDRPRGTTQDA